MDVAQQILLGAALVVLCVLTAVFIVGIHSSMVNAWKDYRDRTDVHKVGPMSEDPLWVAIAATVFAVFFYGLVALAVWVAIS